MYPISVNLKDKSCLVIGGGAIAERRVLGLLGQGARITVVAPDTTPKLREMAAASAIDWQCENCKNEMLDGAFLVIAATNNRDVNAAMTREAQSRNILVCRADKYEDGNFTTPAVVRRGNLVLTVTTEGRSPTLAAIVRERLELEYDAKWESLTALLGALRPAIQQTGDANTRKQMTNRLIEDSGILELLEQERPLEAEARAQCLLSSWE